MAHRKGAFVSGLVVFVLVGLVGVGIPTVNAEVGPEAQAVVQQFAQGPSVFIENVGQWDAPEIRYALDSRGANVGLTDRGPKFQLFKRRETPASPDDGTDKTTVAPAEMREFSLSFDGAAPTAPVGRDRAAQTFNYLNVSPELRRENVPACESVWYENLYPGIDLELLGRRDSLKYNFHVAPGADISSICLRYDGVAGISLADDGFLEICVADGWEPLRDAAPYIYQIVDGRKVPVVGRYDVFDSHNYGFRIIGTYDPDSSLIIDPELKWLNYYGNPLVSIDYEKCNDITLDSQGNVYLTGKTNSPGWISGGWDTSGGNTGFVAKLSSDGFHIWSSYIKGDTTRIAVDINNNILLAGSTGYSNVFSGGWDSTFNGNSDGFVVKLSESGNHLWSTYLGGTGMDQSRSIATDSEGNILVTGLTNSLNWISGGWDTTLDGTYDGYVVKLASNGSHIWSTYIGGVNGEYGIDIAIDSIDNVYITGDTNSQGWISGGWITDWRDGFLVKLSSTGNHIWSSYLPAKSIYDSNLSVAVDNNDNVFVSGGCGSGTSPKPNGGWDTTYNGGVADGYIVKLSSTGAHLWSSFMGGTQFDSSNSIVLDGDDNIYIIGYTDSSSWCKKGWDETNNGNTDGYIVKLNSSGSHVWSSFIGGFNRDDANGIAVNSQGKLFISGYTWSTDWTSEDIELDPSFSVGFALMVAQHPIKPYLQEPSLISMTSITWNWQDNSGDETGFKIWSDPGTGTPATLQTTTAEGMVSWQQTGLSANTQHTFQVAATNEYGDSGKTTPISSWTLANTPMAPIVGNPTGHTLDVTIGTGDGNPSHTEYAVKCLNTGKWLNPQGQAGSTPTWKTASVWGAYTYTGLNDYTTYSFSVTARNGAGVQTVAGPVAAKLTPDVTPPQGTVTVNSGSASTASANVTLGLTSNDGAGSGVTEMQFSNDGNEWSTWETVALLRDWILATGDGQKTVRARFRDAAGNISSIAMDGILLDTTPPTGSVIINGGAEYANTTQSVLSLSCDDGEGSGVAEMQFSNDGLAWSGWEPFSTGRVWALSPGDEEKTVHSRFRDLSGNVSSVSIDAIILDTTPPAGTISIDGGAAYAKTIGVVLALSNNDGDGSGVFQVQFSNDNAVWSVWEDVTETKMWELSSPDGEKSVYARFKDLAGNVSETVSDGIFLDTIPPAVALLINGGVAYTADRIVTLALSCDDGVGSGVSEMQFGDDGASWNDWEPYGDAKNWETTVGDGPKNVYAKIKDLAGNESVVIAGIVLDTVKPVIMLNGDEEVQAECGVPYEDAGSTANDETVGDLTSEILVAGTINHEATGAYALQFTVADPAGNLSDTAIRLVTVVDTTAPVITLLGETDVMVECGEAYTDAGAVATDTCSGELTESIVTVNPVNTAVPGVYTVTYNVTDSAGNAAIETTRIITVVDTTAPVITLLGESELTVGCGDVYLDAGATALDACSGDITEDMIVSNPVNTAFPGVYKVTYNVVDTAGNPAVEIIRTVTVEDTTPPVITICAGDRAVPADASCQGTVPDFTAGVAATDICDTAPAITQSPEAGMAVGLGETAVTVTVTDSAGNFSTCTATLTVEDSTEPVITLLDDEAVFVECGLPYADGGATADDSCDGDLSDDIVTVNPVVSSVPGVYTVTYNVSDEVGNPAVEATRTVIVEDTTSPGITLVGGAETTVECGSAYVDAGATAMDNCDGDLTDSITMDNPVDTAVAEEYTVTYTVTDRANNEAVETRTVRVVDSTIPVITINGLPEVVVECGSLYADAGATATDVCSGNLTGEIVTVNPVNSTLPGVYTVTYNVVDTAGNQAIQTSRTVTVVDTTVPVVTLLGPAEVTVECGSGYADAGATAADACDGNLTEAVVVVNPVNPANPGVYTVTYNVVDTAGNPAVEMTRTVTVVDSKPPVITMLGANTITVGCGSAYSDAGATAMDACDGNLTTAVTVVNRVNTSTPGVYTVTYNVSDGAGNNAVQATRTVAVSDTTGPVINLLGSSDINVSCSDTYTDAGATATDVCSGDLTESIVTLNPVDTAVPGVYTVTYNVVDDEGNNAAEARRTVTVLDTTIPVIIRVGSAELTVECGETYTDAGAVATDTCSGELTESIVSVNPVNTAVPGVYTVTYNVTDSAGNRAVQATRKVTVADTKAPVLTLNGPAAVTVECGQEYLESGATALDQCGGDLSDLIVVTGNLDTTAPGSFILVYSLTDAFGNLAVPLVRTVQVTEGDACRPAPTLEEAMAALSAAFDQTDTNGDGRIDFSEASALLTALTQAIFNQIDNNGDGFLSRTELGLPEEGGCRGCQGEKLELSSGGKRGDWFITLLSLLGLVILGAVCRK